MKNIADKGRKEAVGLSKEDRDDGLGLRQWADQVQYWRGRPCCG